MSFAKHRIELENSAFRPEGIAQGGRGFPEGHATAFLSDGSILFHEMSQPLSAMLTNMEAATRWLARETPDLGKARMSVERAAASARRVAGIMKGIRDMAQGHISDVVEFDVNLLIKDVVESAKPKFRFHSITYDVGLAGAKITVVGNRLQLEQVIANLVKNAIESMTEIHDRERQLRIDSGLGPDGHAIVTVVDNGIGILPEIAHRVFDATFSTKPGGTGLGLALSRLITEAHGGRLSIAQNYPFGAIARVLVPASSTTV